MKVEDYLTPELVISYVCIGISTFLSIKLQNTIPFTAVVSILCGLVHWSGRNG
jgi:hypothetical protein